MKSVGTSKIGLVRKLNEDRFYIEEPFFIVTDGMGGHVGGEIASTMAIDEIIASIHEAAGIDEEVLAEAVQNANQAICAQVADRTDLQGMGTTVVMAYISKKKLYWANVGDSRLYLYRDNELSRITTDHSMVQTLLDSGKITKEEILVHPQRNLLTRAVGVSEDLTVDTGTVAVRPGDRILLCSDGLTGYISEDRIEKIFQNESIEERITEDLMALVYEAGAKDNVTIIVGTL